MSEAVNKATTDAYYRQYAPRLLAERDALLVLLEEAARFVGGVQLLSKEEQRNADRLYARLLSRLNEDKPT
jgi:hypothetical protein